MTDLQTAAQQALEAWDTRAGIDTASRAFEALRAALAQQDESEMYAAAYSSACGELRKVEAQREKQGMAHEDIIRMAKAARGEHHEIFWFNDGGIERFAALVRAAEQDRCCRIVYGMAGSDNVAQRTVDAIRGKE